MKRNFCKKTFVLLAFVIVGAGCNNNNSSGHVTIKNADHVKLPIPDHIVIIIEENHDYSQIIESGNAPYITSLSKDPYSASFIKSYAVTHPSQPNYLDLFSGSNQGVTNNSHPPGAPFTTPNLASQLIRAGKTYSTYAENLPHTGYDGNVNNEYVRKHNPSANWVGTGKNEIPKITTQPFTQFPDDYSKLPTVSIVVPDDSDNMHDGSISKADTWLKDHLNNYIQWAKTHNSLFILTFDEDDMRHGNHIVTIFTGSMIKGGEYSEQINHFNVLRTIEEMYGLSYAGYAASVKPISSCWK